MPWASSFRGGPICTCLVRGLFGARASPAVSGARRGEEVDSIVGESSCARRRVGRRSPVVVLSFFLLKTIPTFSLIQLLNQESWVLGFGAVSSVKVRLTQLPNLRDIGLRLLPLPAEIFLRSVRLRPGPLSSACARAQASSAARRRPHEGPRHSTGTPFTPSAPVLSFSGQLTAPRVARNFSGLSSFRIVAVQQQRLSPRPHTIGHDSGRRAQLL